MARKGRPTKYRPEHCQLAEDYLANGDSLTQFAGSIGVHVDQIHEWRKKHKDFHYSIKKGLEASMAFWEKFSKNAALGVPFTLNGIKYKNYNITMMIFIMKSRFRETYGEHLQLSGGEFNWEDDETLKA